eukprot:TRINITY_DN1193_c0_g1_i1.p1 TRINITY_DN1193_c0_g1~~TRINITY_DN1193_c0_g1_i1.p1  ORF type:complete len:2886 (+),score=664.15 TRINITY_DN1193_c0_g1_i1:256-8658(+)
MEINSNGQIFFAISVANTVLTATGGNTNNGQWHYYTGVRTSLTSIALFVDGSQVATASNSGIGSSLSITVGLSMGACNYFDGSSWSVSKPGNQWIDEWRLWKGVALSAATINTYMNQMVVYTPSISLDWTFEDTQLGCVATGCNAGWLFDKVAPAASAVSLTSRGSCSLDSSQVSLLVPCFACSPSGGTCDTTTGLCVCNFGYSGSSCATILPAPSQCTATGSGLSSATAGVTGTFQIQTRGANGLSTNNNTLTYSVVASLGTATQILTATPTTNGTYVVNYNLTVAGTYQLTITLANQQISGSPFSLVVSPGPTFPGSCYILGGISGWQLPGGGFVAGSSSFTIVSVDRFGNPRTSGGSTFLVSLASLANSATGSVSDLLNGRYQVSLTLTTSGRYNFNVSTGGAFISGIPSWIDVIPADASVQSTAVLTPTTLAVGSALTVNVTSRDTYGNQRFTNLDSFSAALYAVGSNTPLTALFNSTSVLSQFFTISVTTVTVPGSYIIRVWLRSGTVYSQLAGSPYPITLTAGPISAATTTFTGSFTPIAAGSTASLIITPRDAYGNTRPDRTDVFTLMLSGSVSVTGSVVPSAAGDPNFSGSFTTTVAGNFSMSIAIASLGLNIAGAPVLVTVTPGSVSPARSIATGGPISAAITAGVMSQFFVQGRDQYDNPTAFASSLLSVDLATTGTPVISIIDPPFSLGRYAVNITTTVAGSGLPLSVRILGSQILSSPFSITVNSGPLSLSTSSFTAPSSAALSVAQNVTVILSLTDSFGNALTSVSGLSVAMSLSGAASVALSVTSLGGAQYRAVYTPTVAGAYNLSVTVNGQHVAGSPAPVSYFSPSTLSSVSPAFGSSAGGTGVTLFGTGFTTAGLVCRFGSTTVSAQVLSSAQVVCTSPAGTIGSSTSVSVSTNNGLTFSTLVAAYTYIAPIASLSATPTRGNSWGGDIVTITGGPFYNSSLARCRFEDLETPVTYISSSQITCVTPARAASVVTLSVSNNGVDYFSGPFFSFADAFSSLCRTTDELSIGVQDRLSAGLEYFPNLVLNAAGSDVNTDRGYYNFSTKAVKFSEIHDGDRCCDLDLVNNGYLCGVPFSQRTSPMINLEMGIVAGLAYINEVVLSFYDPCRNVPREYYAEYFDGSAWHGLFNRSTSSNSILSVFPRPCTTVPSDKGAVSICTDFFSLATPASAVRVRYDNSAAVMGVFGPSGATDGGWLYEFEIHGIPATTAYRLASSPSTLANILSQSAAAIPAITISTKNFGGTLLGALDTVPHTVTVTLWLLDGPSGTPIFDRSDLLSGTTIRTTAGGSVVFSGLTLLAPSPSYYALIFSSPDQKDARLDFQVVVGLPVSLGLFSSSSLAYTSLSSVPLSDVIVRAYDASETWIASPSATIPAVVANFTDTISASISGGITLAGTTSVLLTAGVADFADLELQAPIPVGTYVLTLESPTLGSEFVSITITAGSPVALLVGSPAGAISVVSRAQAELPSILVRAVDAGNNLCGVLAPVTPVSAALVATTVGLAGTTVGLLVDGDLVFTALSLVSPPAGSYTLRFSAQDLAPVDLTVDVVVGFAVSLGLASSVSLSFQADALIVLPPVVVQSLDAGGTPCGGVDVTTRSVTAQVVPSSGSAAPQMLGTATILMSDGVASFSDLQLVSPAVGSYLLRLSTPDLGQISVAISIQLGLPSAIILLAPLDALSRPTASTVSLPTILIGLVDGANNLITTADAATRTISATAGSVVLAGDTASMEFGRASFAQLELVAPPAGQLSLVFSTAGLTGCTLVVQIVVGPAYSLDVLGGLSAPLATTTALYIPPVELVVRDVGGDSLATLDVQVRTVSVTIDTPTSLNLGQTSFTIVNGAVIISGIVLSSPVPGVHTLTFSSFGLVEDTLSVTILAGSPLRFELQAPTPADTYATDESLRLDTVSLELRDASGGLVDPLFLVQSYIARASILSAPTSAATGAATGVQTTSSGSSVVFSALTLLSPPHGAYLISFSIPSIPGFVPLELNLTVGTGQPISILPLSSLITVLAAPVAQISGAIVVDAGDAAGAAVGATDATLRTIQVVPQSRPLNPVYQFQPPVVNLTMVNGTVVIPTDAFSVVSPLLGTFSLQILDLAGTLLSQTAPVFVVAGAPSRIQIQSILPTQWDNSNNGIVNTPVSVLLLDAVGNIVADPIYDVLLQISPVPRSPTLASYTESAFSGQAVFSTMSTFLGDYGTTYSLSFSVVLLPSVSVVASVSVSPCSSVLQFSVLDPLTGECICQPGLYFNNEVLPGGSKTCTRCPIGTYKPTPGQTRDACQDCALNHTTIALGNIDQTSCVCKDGFYSRSGDSFAGLCLACEVGAYCQGGNIYTQDNYFLCDPQKYEYCSCRIDGACQNGGCAEGYTGPLCNVCEDGYGGFGGTCQKCPKNSANWVILLFLFVFLSLMLVFIVGQASSVNDTPTTIAIKILLNYVQQMALLSGFTLAWPRGVSALFEVSSTATMTGRILAVGCAINLGFYTYLLLYMLLPLIALFGTALVVGIWYFLFSRWEIFILSSRGYGESIPARLKDLRISLRNYGIVAFFVIIFISHPTITKQMFEVFNCVSVGPDAYIATDMSVKCYTNIHYLWSVLAALMLSGYCLLVPLLAGIFLYRMSKREISAKKILIRFQFLYSGYTRKRYYWETVIMMRKLFLVFFLVFARNAPTFQNVCGQWVFLFALMLQFYFQPFLNKVHHRLEAATLSVIYLTILTGSLFAQSYNADIDRAISTIVIVANSVVLVSCVVTLVVMFLSRERLAALKKALGLSTRNGDDKVDEIELTTRKGAAPV